MRAYNQLIKLISTFFYIGYLPVAPGTFGSIAAIGLFYLVRNNISINILVVFVLALGLLVSGQAERIYQKKDADYIVIDEVAGMLITLLFIPCNLFLVITGFFLFRLFDILKPYPALGLQGIKGSVGVMIDDVVAGLYANIVLQAVVRFTSLRGS